MFPVNVRRGHTIKVNYQTKYCIESKETATLVRERGIGESDRITSTWVLGQFGP